MEGIVVYKSKYGSTKDYAQKIAEELGCEIKEAKSVNSRELGKYDYIVYGGGLYAEVINGVGLITKNIESLRDKKIAVFTTGITPIDKRDYYDKEVIEKNFKEGIPQNIKIFNYLGKMKTDELSVVHRGALATLKKIMQSKKNKTELENLLIELCDFNDDLTDTGAVYPLIDYIKG